MFRSCRHHLFISLFRSSLAFNVRSGLEFPTIHVTLLYCAVHISFRSHGEPIEVLRYTDGQKYEAHWWVWVHRYRGKGTVAMDAYHHLVGAGQKGLL